MRYIINKSNKALLNKADYINISWKDHEEVLDLAHDYAAHIIVDVPAGTPDQDIAKVYQEGNERVIFKVHDISTGRLCRDHRFAFFFDNYLKNFQELYWAINEFNASYVMLDAPLFHEIAKVREFGVPITLTPTTAIHDVYDRSRGLEGTYILPQDAKLYDDCIFTFGGCDSNREKTLYEIYERGEWPGRLDMLIWDLDTEALNSLIVEDFGEHRANCGMRCMSAKSSCHICQTVIGLAEKKKELEEYKEVR